MSNSGPDVDTETSSALFNIFDTEDFFAAQEEVPSKSRNSNIGRRRSTAKTVSTDQELEFAETNGKDALTIYLEKRGEALTKFHPQWDFTNDEIENCNDLLKRDLTPICIPPSWDLIQKYAGATNPNADGHDKVLYDEGKRHYAGDEGESRFLAAMRQLEIGGILFGDISKQHLMYGKDIPYKMKDVYMLPRQITKRLKKAGDFQFDFLYIHANAGLFLIEVKNYGSRKLAKKIRRAFGQLKKERRSLFNLIKKFVEAIGGSDDDVKRICARITSILCVNNVVRFKNRSKNHAWNMDLTHYFTEINLTASSFNNINDLRDDACIRKFAILLAGYRPDCFISPVRCVMHISENLFTHGVNAENFYHDTSNIRQNLAITVQKFLEQRLLLLPNKNINFGKYSGIYLTETQMQAVGYFKAAGDFQPRKQIICGPAGSGKTIIMMLKMFILAQLDRRHILVFRTHSADHRNRLRGFANNNKPAFHRQVHVTAREIKHRRSPSRRWKLWHKQDMLIDEERGPAEDADDLINAYTNTTYYIILVITGRNGDMVTFNDPLRPAFDDAAKAEEIRQIFEITEVTTAFRSTNRIQQVLMGTEFNRAPGVISGHNFDGVKVERYLYDDDEHMHTAIKQRIDRLVLVEECRQMDIGLRYQLGGHSMYGRKMQS